LGALRTDSRRFVSRVTRAHGLSGLMGPRGTSPAPRTHCELRAALAQEDLPTEDAREGR
jgi:hypothetical protein